MRKVKKQSKRILSTSLAALTLISSSGLTGLTSLSNFGEMSQVFAAEKGDASVNIAAEATTVNVTMPTDLPIVFNEDGTNTYPTHFNIANNSSLGGIHLASAYLDADGSGWKLLNESTDTTKLAKNTKKVKFYVNSKIITPATVGDSSNPKQDEIGTASFEEGDFNIEASKNKDLTFKVDRGAFTEASSNANAYKMKLNFEFNEEEQNQISHQSTLISGKEFNEKIPSNVDSIIFTDEIPDQFYADLGKLVDLSAEQNGSIVGWKDDYSNYKISSRNKGTKIKLNKDCSNMFYNVNERAQEKFPYLENIDLSNIDTNTSNVTDMSNMFFNCKKITSLDVSNWDTSNVTDMSYMFGNCNSLTSLDVSNFNTSNVTNMNSMFACGSYKLTSLDVSNFDTSKVTNMSGMFSGGVSLTSLDVSNFNTSNVTDMSSMFSICSSLNSLDVSNFDTSNVIFTSNMFSDCNSLNSLDISSFDTTNVKYMYEMFNNCSNLKTLYVSKAWNILNVINSTGMFGGCACIKGQSGTTYNKSKTDKLMANYQTGYLTLKK
mgnify:CR=1 FL=1